MVDHGCRDADLRSVVAAGHAHHGLPLVVDDDDSDSDSDEEFNGSGGFSPEALEPSDSKGEKERDVVDDATTGGDEEEDRYRNGDKNNGPDGFSPEAPESDDKEDEAEEDEIQANRANDCEDNSDPDDVHMGEGSNQDGNGADREESDDGSLEVLPPKRIKSNLGNKLKRRIALEDDESD